MEDSKNIVVKIQKADVDPQYTIAAIDFCPDCVTITINKQSIHLEWSEIISWPQWLAENIEK